MEFQEVFAQLRQRTGLSQSEVAERLFVTRQAVSRWERGETIPEVETLQALSRLFGVSINTLLGSPRTLVCQSCGMPLSDDILAKNTDGSFNEQYWHVVLGWRGLCPGLHHGGDGGALPAPHAPGPDGSGGVPRLYAEPSAHTGAMERELTQAPDCGNPRSGAWIFSGQLRKTAFAHIDPMGELPERIRSMAADAGWFLFAEDHRVRCFIQRKRDAVSFIQQHSPAQIDGNDDPPQLIQFSHMACFTYHCPISLRK